MPDRMAAADLHGSFRDVIFAGACRVYAYGAVRLPAAPQRPADKYEIAEIHDDYERR